MAPIAERYFDVTERGNFEGKNILHRTIDIHDAAALFHLSAQETEQRLAEIRRRLFAAREQRVNPARDEKMLAAWNGMMIGALAEGFIALGEPRLLQAAVKAADFVMSKLWDGRALRRSYGDGVARFNGYLEDYAIMANALLDLMKLRSTPAISFRPAFWRTRFWSAFWIEKMAGFSSLRRITNS